MYKANSIQNYQFKMKRVMATAEDTCLSLISDLPGQTVLGRAQPIVDPYTHFSYDLGGQEFSLFKYA